MHKYNLELDQVHPNLPVQGPIRTSGSKAEDLLDISKDSPRSSMGLSVLSSSSSQLSPSSPLSPLSLSVRELHSAAAEITTESFQMAGKSKGQETGNHFAAMTCIIPHSDSATDVAESFRNEHFSTIVTGVFNKSQPKPNADQSRAILKSCLTKGELDHSICSVYSIYDDTQKILYIKNFTTQEASRGQSIGEQSLEKTIAVAKMLGAQKVLLNFSQVELVEMDDNNIATLPAEYLPIIRGAQAAYHIYVDKLKFCQLKGDDIVLIHNDCYNFKLNL